jgi:hypothetical protein
MPGAESLINRRGFSALFLSGMLMTRAGQQTSVQGFALLNSGETNPHWSLTDDDISRLKSSLKGLRVAAEPSWPQLGWRGFLVVTNGLRELPEEIRAFQGTIRTQSGKRVRYYHDTRGLERWLDGEARSRGIAIP